MIGCAAIILTGLSYQDKSRYLDFGLNLLKKIIKFSFDNEGFPKSRSIKQLNFYLKYFILIREWLKESQNDVQLKIFFIKFMVHRKRKVNQLKILILSII